MTEREIFTIALTRENPAERAAFLDEACSGDDALRLRVESLLVEYQRLGSFMDVPSTLNQAPQERLGTQIGPYKLLQQIGEGGMGVVYMAEQTEPVKRKVALKLIKPGMDSHQVIARFEAERQALAMMDHVNIARVLDAGTIGLSIDDFQFSIDGKPPAQSAIENQKSEIENVGRPYFVMELIHGVPITKYSDDNHLTPRQRLELFVPVCHAIQHAHQKGIIHRDIKPSNVMITLYDGKPVPKVIDFGVAKATEQKLTERTLFTQYGTMVGTLEYMSPEQAEMSAVGVDTRSDIYSLGVLLYELLTGSTPLSRKRMKEAGYAEILRLIKEEEPPRPSTRLSESGGALASISAQRKTEPGQLSKLMRGELDWIVMKTLEKDRNRRYETANGFAADVQRYLNDEAVQACPPSAGYRLRKFVRRNLGAVTTVSLLIAMLFFGTTVSTWQAIRATLAEGLAEQHSHAENQARIEAEANFQNAREAGDQFFTRVSESRLLDEPGLQPLRTELLETAARYYQRLTIRESDDPQALADVTLSHLRLAQAYYQAGLFGRHLSALDEGMRLAERLFREHPEAITAHVRLSGFWHGGRMLESIPVAQPDSQGALRIYQEATRLWEKLSRRYPREIGFQSDLSKFYELQVSRYSALGKPTEALLAVKRVCEIREQVAAADSGDYEHVAELAYSYIRQASLLDLSEPQTTEALYHRALLLQKDAPDVPSYQQSLADHQAFFSRFLVAQRRPQEAIPIYQQAVTIYRKLLVRFPHVAAYRSTLNVWEQEIANLQAGRGHFQGQRTPEQVLEKARLLLQDLQADDAPAGLYVTASLYRQAGDSHGGSEPQRAALAYQSAVDLFEKLVADSPIVPEYREQLADSYSKLAGWLRIAGKLSAMEQADQNAIAIREKLVSDFPSEPRHRLKLADLYNTAGYRLSGVGKYQESEKKHRQAADLSEKLATEFPDAPIYRWELARSHFSLGICFRWAGRYTEGESSFRHAIKAKESIMAESSTPTAERSELGIYYCDLGTLLVAADKPKEAEQAFRQGLILLDDSGPASNNPVAHPYFRVLGRSYLIGLLQASGRASEADEEFHQILDVIPDAVQQKDMAWSLARATATYEHRLANTNVTVRLAKKAVEYAPDKAAYWTTLGVAQYRADQWKDSVAALNKSMELGNGGNSFDFIVLAMAHWQLGNKVEALQWYDRAVLWMEKNRPKDEELCRFRDEAKELLGIQENGKPKKD